MTDFSKDATAQSVTTGEGEQPLGAEVGLGLKRASQFPRSSDIPPEMSLDYVKEDKYLAGGEIKTWTGDMTKVCSPIGIVQDNGTVVPHPIGEYPSLSAQAGLEALECASAAFNRGLGEWPQMPVEGRIACVERFLDRMVEKRAEVVKLIVWEICKTVPDAEKEFDRTVEYVRDTITALREMQKNDSSPRLDDGITSTMSRAPIGVTLCMSPFNYPLNETFTTLIPALIMGNTTILKTPRYGVLLFSPLLEAFRDSFPAGVVNTLSGSGKELITPIMESGKVDVLAFIGSSKVADSISKAHPNPHRLRQVLGMGAKNPAIVLPDCDLQSAAKEFVKGALTYNGQRCTALKIAYVHKSRAEEFAELVAGEVEALKMGMPWEEGVRITPVAEDGKTGLMQNYVQDALERGARIGNRGGGTAEHTLFAPAVLFPVSPSMRIYNEEQFGPIVPVAVYDDLSEVVEAIADSPFRQQASIFGNDENEMRNLSRTLQALLCRVNLNKVCQRGPDVLPFTGMRDSAQGTLSITDALKVFSVESLCCE